MPRNTIIIDHHVQSAHSAIPIVCVCVCMHGLVGGDGCLLEITANKRAEMKMVLGERPSARAPIYPVAQHIRSTSNVYSLIPFVFVLRTVILHEGRLKAEAATQLTAFHICTAQVATGGGNGGRGSWCTSMCPFVCFVCVCVRVCACTQHLFALCRSAFFLILCLCLWRVRNAYL